MDFMSILIEVVFAFWFFFLGASIGSFSNVLAYRWPRGLPVGASISRCPHCQHSIRFSDNVPALSWLLLRGKCRFCQWPIPPRYFFVEVLFGAMFLLLYFVDVRFKARDQWLSHSLDQVLRFENLTAFGHHAFLLSCLAVATLMRWDGNAPPRRYWLIASIIGCVAAFAVPSLYWTSISVLVDHLGRSWFDRLTALIAAIAGGQLGYVLALMDVRGSHLRDGTLMAVGVFLGPAGLILSCVLMLLCRLLLRLFSEPSEFRTSLATLLATATTILALESFGLFL